jgi:predicted type IV restriction endonuclease
MLQRIRVNEHENNVYFIILPIFESFKNHRKSSY